MRVRFPPPLEEVRMKELRDYQRKCIDSLYEYWRGENPGHGLLVVPTGGGKSLVMAALIQEICERWPGTRLLLLTHVKELIQQDYDEIRAYWPDAPMGIFSAGIGRKELQAQILVAGIQSIDKHAHRLIPPPEIVLIDEADLIPRSESTRYRKVLKTLSQMYPDMKCIGLSATPYRLDSGWLHLGKDAIFDKIVYDVPVQELIDKGYLCPVVPYGSPVKIDIANVHHSGKEFLSYELEEAAMSGDITEQAVNDMVRRAADRKKWLIFACGKKHADQIKAQLDVHGINSAIITDSTPKKERDDIIDMYKNNSARDPIRALINVNILTTGFNAPAIDMIAMLRPTESCRLYVQSVGRGMRTYPGKENCLVLDYAGNTIRHGPIDAVHPEAQWEGDGSGLAPVKECPECFALVLAAVRVCPRCGFVFPKVEIQIESKPSEAPLLKSQVPPAEPEKLDVEYTEYRLHTKTGKPDSVCITYHCGLQDVREWICPESGGQLGQYFYGQFCKAIGIQYPYPPTARDFLQNILPQAKRIISVREGKWDKVKAREWTVRIENNVNDDIPF
jgi:DNA repair protein RadD